MERRDPETGQFVKGHIGGPGRPEGSRNRLGRALLEALEADFGEHGANAIVSMRERNPADYVRVIAGLLPKELLVKQDTSLDEISDAELINVLASIRALLASGNRPESGNGTAQEASSIIAH